MEQVSDSQQKLEKKIQTEYKKAYAEIRKKFLADKKKLQEQDVEKKRELNAGQITQSEYDRWRTRLENRLKRDVQKMTIILNGADQLAVDMSNEVIPKEYADGINEETYHIEKDLNIDTNFTLVNEDAVIDAVEGKFLADIDYERNNKWNQRRISSAITQGIIAGDSIPAIADRLLPLVNSNKASATRNARTWTHAARSGGEQQAAERAVNKGVMIEKWWVAVTDLKTRISHRQLYGERKEVTEPFSNGGMYPCDPNLPPAERYNCRCSLRYLHKGLTPDFDGELKNLNGMTLEEWKAGKDKEKKQAGNVVDLPKKPVRPSVFDYEGGRSNEQYHKAYELYKLQMQEYDAKVNDIVQKQMNAKGFDNWDDAKKWAGSVGVNITDAFEKNVDINTLKGVRPVIDRLAKEFPQITKGYTTEYMDGSKTQVKFNLDYKHTYDYLMEAGNGITFGNEFSDYKSVLAQNCDNMASGFLVKGDGTFKACVAHEFGHDVDSYIRGKMRDKYHAAVDDWRQNFNTYDEYESAQKAYKNTKMQYMAELTALAKRAGSSEYSNTNEFELFAEGFAEYIYGNSDFGKEFGKFLKRWYK